MKRKVLIIDDEKDFCVLLKSYLIPLNYEVHLAYTLKEGLEKVESLSPDILFLDNNLPDGLGWEELSALREKLPHTKINLTSAYRYPAKELENVPSIKFLEKPISLNALKSIL